MQTLVQMLLSTYLPSENTSDSKEVSKAKRQPKMQPVKPAAAVTTTQQKESSTMERQGQAELQV